MLSTAVTTCGVVVCVHAVNRSAEDPEPFFLHLIYFEGFPVQFTKALSCRKRSLVTAHSALF